MSGCGYWGVQLTTRPHRYGMAPPQGFAQWFDYAKRNNVKLLDEYDSILERIRPFASLPRDVLRQRSDMLQHDKTCVLLYAARGERLELTLFFVQILDARHDLHHQSARAKRRIDRRRTDARERPPRRPGPRVDEGLLTIPPRSQPYDDWCVLLDLLEARS